ncbi:serine-rich and transmembrane domain-containing 2-like [Myxocyprinus asiaticus]|uniref:serine-rich and transmembrane domain-containing 2-like n=1 Tax=Myxocyprinus asiaticus TaxID=70543 RepID=UPI0022238830|nr:serine-rich and transmembrane domain-containing 2-like [Myxocyprinus asiaticus]
MIDERIIWRNFFTPTPEDLPKLLLNRSTEETIWTTTAAHIGRPDPRLPSLSTYLGLFVCLLLVLLALVIVMLYRMKHTIAPLPSDVESAGQTEMFPEDGSEGSSHSAD